MISQAAQRPRFWEAHMEQFQTTNIAESDIAVLAAIELSKTTWLLAIHDPISNKVSRRRADGGEDKMILAEAARGNF
jgi:hypothetical protein